MSWEVSSEFRRENGKALVSKEIHPVDAPNIHAMCTLTSQHLLCSVSLNLMIAEPQDIST